MSTPLARKWADEFGLAIAPLFEADETAHAETHNVLLDGGFGSFAMSVSDEPLWRAPATAAWAWSSNLPHHVTVTPDVVAVRRWDQPKAEEFSRSSVDAQIEPFYAYLTTDRVRSSQRVVEHVVHLFRRMRSLVADARIPDDQSVAAFLMFLNLLIDEEKQDAKKHEFEGSTLQDKGILHALPAAGLRALLEDVNARTPMQSFRLFPSLAVRHAGSEIFQEAHFELVRAPGLDLFGYAGPAESKSATRGGAHFTPAALARSIVEQTLSEVEDLRTRKHLTILDPACGSGAFLQEAIRSLRRVEFDGELRLVGRDISPAAIAMAEFVVGHALGDWKPRGGVITDLGVDDSLEADLPFSDVVLMNPPFIAWSALDSRQRDQMREVLGTRLQGRGDLSMAFVTRAIDLLNPGGAIGVLLPSSLMTLQAAEEWRTDLLQRGDLRLLASLGDYGLFAHALVQIAAAVIASPSDPSKRRDVARALISTNSADATGGVLRMLRRTNPGDEATSHDGTWQIFPLPTKAIAQRPTWRLTSPKTETALARLLDAGAARIGDLFEVRQGVRTGDNKAFLLSEASLKALPVAERRYFRRALMNDSIKDGELGEEYWVFYPYGDSDLEIANEDALKARLPTYYNRHLLPRRSELGGRSSLRGGNWWDLSWSRSSWALDKRPRLVSKYFGGPGGIAVDLQAQFIVVQGFAWMPKWTVDASDEDNGVRELIDTDLLFAYAAMMNSNAFGRILELFSPHVAGGQFDLSPRYVDQIPVPNLAELAKDERVGRLVTRLAALGREPRMNDFEWRGTVDRITAELYGGEFFGQA